MISEEIKTLMLQTWFFIPNWQWLTLVIASGLSFFLRPFIELGLRQVKKNWPWKNQKTFLGYLAELSTERVGSWILVCAFWLVLIDVMDLPATMSRYLSLLTKLLLAIYLLRFIYIAVDAFGLVLKDMAAKTESARDDQLVPFATKTLKVVLVVFGALLALQNIGFNVMGVLAGLGLGGLALALAAQDTAANLFGSITILLDAPFNIGDLVKITDTEGTVEEIGFRSTRLRTLHNSVVTIPNSVVAKEKIDNLGARRSRRVRQVLGLHYDTSPEKIQAFIEALRYSLRLNERVDQERVTVYFVNFNASTLDVLVNFHWLNVLDNTVEQDLTQQFFLEILRIGKKLDIEFAYPTQSLYVRGPELAANATQQSQ